MKSTTGGSFRVALTAAALMIAMCGCKRNTTSHSSLSSAVNGRQINASIDGPGFIQQDTEAAIITFPGHKVRVEKERLLVDEKESAKIAAIASRIDVVVSNATITVLADSTNIFTTQITR